jgi:uncharacterized protein with PhoU and TrkA domain
LGFYPLAELPVLDDAGHFLGTISRREILAFYDREKLRQQTTRLAFVDTSGAQYENIVRVSTDEIFEHIPVTAKLAGQTLRSLDLRAKHGVQVHGIRDKTQSTEGTHMPSSGEALVEGDELVVSGSRKSIGELRRLAGLL